MFSAAVAEVVPDAGVHLSTELPSEVGNWFSVWLNVACLGDMFFNVAHFVQERVKQFRSR